MPRSKSTASPSPLEVRLSCSGRLDSATNIAYRLAIPQNYSTTPPSTQNSKVRKPKRPIQSFLNFYIFSQYLK